MKKKTIDKEFKAVDFMRMVRYKISKDIQDMDFKQIKEYFAQTRKTGRIIPEQKDVTILNP
jgi:hypothetical protein